MFIKRLHKSFRRCPIRHPGKEEHRAFKVVECCLARAFRGSLAKRGSITKGLNVCIVAAASLPECPELARQEPALRIGKFTISARSRYLRGLSWCTRGDGTFKHGGDRRGARQIERVIPARLAAPREILGSFVLSV
jgi:hypothetical protein